MSYWRCHVHQCACPYKPSYQYQRMKAERDRYRKALEDCFKLDRSKEYEYGEPNRNGIKPGVGKRWLTPKELAKSALGGEGK